MRKKWDTLTTMSWRHKYSGCFIWKIYNYASICSSCSVYKMMLFIWKHKNKTWINCCCTCNNKHIYFSPFQYFPIHGYLPMTKWLDNYPPCLNHYLCDYTRINVLLWQWTIRQLSALLLWGYSKFHLKSVIPHFPKRCDRGWHHLTSDDVT